MSFVSKLNLNNFRCYENAALEGLNSGLLVFHGANGAGKTNILEALSYLSPGRGLRSAKATDVQKQGTEALWAVSTEINGDGVANNIGVGLNPETQRKIIKVNGVQAKNQNALVDYVSCLWLTPQMDRLFIEGASGRRRFLDRMIFAFDPAHAGRVTRYENALRQRSKLLQEETTEWSWVDSLEEQMAESTIAITATRLDFLEKLKLSFVQNEAQEKYFPAADIVLEGDIEYLLQNKTAVEAEKDYIELLKQSRPYDAVAGGAKEGIHKSDMVVTYKTKNMPAAQCSTGEQKALLISIVMAQSKMIAIERGAPPILLLDEIAAHLDEDRREALFDYLSALGGQVWMTGTDPVLFDSISKKAQFFAVNSGQILQP